MQKKLSAAIKIETFVDSEENIQSLKMYVAMLIM